jgi:putative ABC transport system ATP-binding protein
MTSATTSTATLDARGLHRFYRRGDGEVAALKDVSLTVAPAEMVAVIGPSGSGKSTLLNLLAGLDDPDGGSVWVGEDRLSHRKPTVQARLRGTHIGMLTQTSGLVEHLSVRGNVVLAGSIRRSARARNGTPPDDEGRANADDLLTSLGIHERADARPSTLSGGETARAGLAVALVGSPTVLLADEPTAEVSRDEEAGILALLRRAHSQAATVLVTHSAAVATAADRVIELVDGRLR